MLFMLLMSWPTTRPFPDSDSQRRWVLLPTNDFVSLLILSLLLPSSPPPPCLLSPTQRSGSWKEISIRNPLVKHAARAYLQPMSTPDVDNRGLFRRLKDQCGCIGWFNDIVLKPLMVKFFGRGEENSDEYDDDEDDYLRRD